VAAVACPLVAPGVHALTGDARDPEAVRFFTQWLGSGIEQMARGRPGR
jgi:hypothetical protein